MCVFHKYRNRETKSFYFKKRISQDFFQELSLFRLFHFPSRLYYLFDWSHSLRAANACKMKNPIKNTIATFRNFQYIYIHFQNCLNNKSCPIDFTIVSFFFFFDAPCEKNEMKKGEKKNSISPNPRRKIEHRRQRETRKIHCSKLFDKKTKQNKTSRAPSLPKLKKKNRSPDQKTL